MKITTENRAKLRQIMLCSLRTTDESIDRSLSLIILALLGDLDLLEQRLEETEPGASVHEGGWESCVERGAELHVQNELIEYIAIARNNLAASAFLRNISSLDQECRGVVEQMGRIRLRLLKNADGLELPDGGDDFVRNLTFFIHDFRELSEVMERLKKVLHQFCQSMAGPSPEHPVDSVQ